MESNSSRDTHEDPLIKSSSKERGSNNPVYNERSSSGGSKGSVNSGLESDPEKEVDFADKQESNRSDNGLSKMTKTYV